MSTLQTLDWIIIAGYFIIILDLAGWVIKQRLPHPSSPNSQ